MSIAIAAKVGSSVSVGNTASSGHNSVIESLQSRKIELQNQIKEVNASKMDSKTKVAKVKEINEQIAAIEQQIQQARVQEQQEKMQEAIAKNAEKTAKEQQEQNKDQDGGGVVLSASLSQMALVGGQVSNLKTLSGVRSKLQGEMNVAEAQMKNSLTGGSTAYQMSVISNNSGQLAQTEQRMANTMKNIDKIHKATQKGIEEADKEAKTTGNDKKTSQSEETADAVTSDGKPIAEEPNEKNKTGQKNYQAVDIMI